MSTSGDDESTSLKGPGDHHAGGGAATHRMKALPIDFVPSDDDVICGRGKKCYFHVGNDRFRDRVLGALDLYRQAGTKLEKSKVLNMVVDQVRQKSPAGGFVKQDEWGQWHEVGDFLAREKTSQAFRDALHENYKSSSVSKRKKRRQGEMCKTTTWMPQPSVGIAEKIQSMSMKKKKAKTDATAEPPQQQQQQQQPPPADPQADIIAGIHRFMCQDTNVALPNIVANLGEHSFYSRGLVPSMPLHFELVQRRRNAEILLMVQGIGLGPSFFLPSRPPNAFYL